MELDKEIAVDNFMETHSGKKFNYDKFDPESVCIHDIAVHLSKICRFIGACKNHYSVAQHSVILSKVVPEGYELTALLHDAAEAYTGDIARPVKNKCPEIKKYEKDTLPKIFKALDVNYDPKLMEFVTWADDRLLITEKKQIMPDKHYYGEIEKEKPFKVDVSPVTHYEAKWDFLKRWTELTGRGF